MTKDKCRTQGKITLLVQKSCLSIQNFSLLSTFWTMEDTILSPHNLASIYKPSYFTCWEALMTCSLQTIQKCSTLPSVRLGPNNMLSVFPKCNDNLLSTNQSEQDSKTLPSFFDIKSTRVWEKRIALSSAYKINLQSWSILKDILSLTHSLSLNLTLHKVTIMSVKFVYFLAKMKQFCSFYSGGELPDPPLSQCSATILKVKTYLNNNHTQSSNPLPF